MLHTEKPLDSADLPKKRARLIQASSSFLTRVGGQTADYRTTSLLSR
jgi:hypothetical protein